MFVVHKLYYIVRVYMHVYIVSYRVTHTYVDIRHLFSPQSGSTAATRRDNMHAKQESKKQLQSNPKLEVLTGG